MATGTAFTVAVNPKIPRRLARLEELANDLWYSWDRSTRSLFSRLNPSLWGAVGHNPKAFLKRVDESLLLRAARTRYSWQITTAFFRPMIPIVPSR